MKNLLLFVLMIALLACKVSVSVISGCPTAFNFCTLILYMYGVNYFLYVSYSMDFMYRVVSKSLFSFSVYKISSILFEFKSKISIASSNVEFACLSHVISKNLFHECVYVLIPYYIFNTLFY